MIIDNASVHTSYESQENIERWEKPNLTIAPIAPCSPELNGIEILLRKIKYEWMPFSAYESFQNLKESFFDMFWLILEISYTKTFSQVLYWRMKDAEISFFDATYNHLPKRLQILF